MKNPALWSRFQRHAFKPVGSLQFDMWVAEELGLSRRKSLLAVEEYRRAMYLLAITDRPLSLPPLLAGFRAARRDAGLTDSSLGVVDGSTLQSQSKLTLPYADTLAIYRAEFGKPLARKAWPHPFLLAAGGLAGAIFNACLLLGFFAGVAGFLAGAKPLMMVANICMMICVGCMVWIWIMGPWGILVTKADGG